jgi:hypothetical protein
MIRAPSSQPAHASCRRYSAAAWRPLRWSISTDLADHPKNVNVREDAILERLEDWIAFFTNAVWLAAGQQAASGENPAAAALHERITELDRKIENLVVASEDAPESAAVLATKLSQRTSERDDSAAKLKRLKTTTVLTVAGITTSSTNSAVRQGTDL